MRRMNMEIHWRTLDSALTQFKGPGEGHERVWELGAGLSAGSSWRKDEKGCHAPRKTLKPCGGERQRVEVICSGRSSPVPGIPRTIREASRVAILAREAAVREDSDSRWTGPVGACWLGATLCVHSRRAGRAPWVCLCGGCAAAA